MASDRVSATATSIEILEALRRVGPAGVTEIATAVDGSKANVHKHLATLEAAHFVRSTNGEYQLAHRSLEFAMAAKERESVYREGVDNLSKLADVTGTTTLLVVREGLEGVYLHTIPGGGRNDPVGLEGTRAPLPEMPGGLAILSCYDPEKRRSLVEATVDDGERAEAILERLGTIEQQSVVVSNSAHASGPEEILAPILTDDGAPAGALGLYRPVTGTDSARVETDLRKLVRNTANTVSNRLSLTQ